MPKPKITKVNPEATKAWKETTPYGGSTEQWRDWGKSNPNRVSNAARTMREPKKTRTEKAGEDTKQWLSRRPKGGGRGVAAPHQEWVTWGKSKPGRASSAGKTIASQRKPKQKITKVKKK